MCDSFFAAAYHSNHRQRVGHRAVTDGRGNYLVDCNLLNPALQNNLATGGDLCAAVGGNYLNFGNANPNTTTINRMRPSQQLWRDAGPPRGCRVAPTAIAAPRLARLNVTLNF